MSELIALVNTQQGAVTALATVVIAFATVVTVLLTFRLANENRLLRKAGTEPEVVAYLTTDRRYKTEVNFVLANVGQGPARNVRFSLEADEDDFKAHDVALWNAGSRTAISTLPQSERMSAFFGQGHRLFAGSRLKPFKVKVQYENINGDECLGEYQLDVSQFDGLITLGVPAEHEVAESLKKIERHLGAVVGGTQRLKVETMTKGDVRREQEGVRREQEEAVQMIKARGES